MPDISEEIPRRRVAKKNNGLMFRGSEIALQAGVLKVNGKKNYGLTSEREDGIHHLNLMGFKIPFSFCVLSQGDLIMTPNII